MYRQLLLDFSDQPKAPRPEERPDAAASPSAADIDAIAQGLRPRIVDHLRQATGQVAIRDLRQALGHPLKLGASDPLSNPVNLVLKQMRDAGDIVCREFDRGDPVFSLPSTIDLPAEPVPAVAPSEHTSEQLEVSSPPPLVRPDRQLTFGGIPFYDWPKPFEDRDRITVDRIRDDIDGPSHRFVIQRHDTVEVFFRRDRVSIGEVVGISHARQEVRVRFREDTEGIWFAVGQIYPAPPTEPEPEPTGTPLSKIVETASPQPAGGFTEADRVSHEPFTLQTFRDYRTRFDAGETTLAEHQQHFARLQATRDTFLARLKSDHSAAQLKNLAARFGCFDSKRNNKQNNAEHVYRVLVQSFTLGNGIRFDPMRETLEDAAARDVAAITHETWQQQHEERAADRQAQEKAHSNPETLDQFRTFARDLGADSLSDAQYIRFDELLADESRARRKAHIAETVTRIESAQAADLTFTIKKGWHDKRKIALSIVQLDQRVDRPTFNELNRKAKMLGGWYSSFKAETAGFQFTTDDHAQRFASLLNTDADRTDVLADRKARKMQSAAERLSSVADTLEADAADILDSDGDKLKNTVRRSEMAAGMRGQAYAKQAMTGTLRSIAASLDTADTRYLDGLRAATQVTTCVRLLRRGKTLRNAKLLADRGDLGVWERHLESENLDTRPLAVEDAAFAEYPFPSLSRCWLADLVKQAQHERGLKQRSRKMGPFLATQAHYVSFVDPSDILFLSEYLQLCRDAGLDTRWLDCGMEDYRRLHAANIHTPQELRCALRELLPHLRKRREDDPVAKAEQLLVGRKIPGFFPTPKAVIARMLELADIEPGHRVLEPSAGKGDIIDMLAEHCPEAPVTAFEINGTLHDVLAAKGHAVQRSDFLQTKAEYDRIVMNPPFETGQDMEHVRHAYEQLAHGGRLVSVLSEGPFFREDAKSVDFRAWIQDLGGDDEKLPEKAFAGRDAFRQTSVQCRLLVLQR